MEAPHVSPPPAFQATVHALARFSRNHFRTKQPDYDNSSENKSRLFAIGFIPSQTKTETSTNACSQTT